MIRYRISGTPAVSST